MKEKAIYYLIWFVKQLHPAFANVSVDVIFAQAWHETGGFTSAIFKENNNMFGLKLAKRRRTTATGENRGHAVYSNWYYCIQDYFLRQENFKIDGTSDDNYMHSTLGSGYAEDQSYLTAWRKVLNSTKGKFIAGGVLLMLFF